jgi:hypothetical protein
MTSRFTYKWNKQKYLLYKNRRTRFQIIGYPVNKYGNGQRSNKTRKRDAESKDKPSSNLEESEWSDENRSPSPSTQEEMEEESVEVVNIGLDTNVMMSQPLAIFLCTSLFVDYL